MGAAGFVSDVKRFAVHDGPGIRTTLFLKGCPLNCLWCHNPEGISPKPQLAFFTHNCIRCGECLSACKHGVHELHETGRVLRRENCVACGACEEACLGGALRLYGRTMTAEEAKGIALEDRGFYEQSGGGVTLSGGEPLLQADFCRALLRALKEEGIHTAADTCGCVGWDAFEKVLPFTDMFLFDIKHGNDAEHRKLTGCGNRLIIDNLKRLSGLAKRIEIRLPLVPGCNDSEETIRGIGRLLGPLGIEAMKILPYHSLARSRFAALAMKDTMPDVPSPSDDDLKRVAAMLREYGVNAVSGRE
jgi:glycyl-radical enzyme activating protein